MSYHNHPERHQVIQQALQARTEPEVVAALARLKQWVQAHPDDESIRDAYEPLILRQMAFEQAASLPVLALKANSH